MFRSLGLATECLVMDGLSTFEDLGDSIVQRTPSEPDFWFGNTIIYKHAPTSVDALEAEFRSAFPDARHICLQWDLPDVDLDAFQEAGFEVEHADVLTLSTDLRRSDLAPGLTVRQPATQADWAALVDLSVEIGTEDGHDPDQHRPYVERRHRNRRTQLQRGLGAWFCVYRDDELVASMGVLWNQHLIRFQDVQTRIGHRGQGICAALLGRAGTWAMERAPDATPVIIAEADGAAGRIYRRSGFSLTEKVHSALRRGYDRRSDAVT